MNGARLATPSTQAAFVALSSFGGPPPDAPGKVPWTHRRAPGELPAANERTGATNASEIAQADVAASDTEDEIGPDLSPEETVAAPTGGIPEGEVPGVLV
jgi:hypothetical protein